MGARTTLGKLLRLLLTESDRDVRMRLLAALALVTTGGLLTALAPLALKGLVDALTHAPAGARIASQVLDFVLAYLAALGLGRLFSELRPRLMGAAEQRLQTRLSRRFFAHVVDLPATYHLNRQTGALSQSLSQGTVACQLVVANLVQGLPIAIEFVTVIAVLGHLGQPALAAVFAASAAAYALAFRKGTARVRVRGKEVSAATIATHAVLADALLNIETIKCFNGASAACQRYGQAAQALEHRWSALHRQRTWLGLTVAAVFCASVATALLVAISAVEAGTLSIGGFVLCTVYMLQMTRPIEMLGAAVRDIGQATEFVRPLLEVMDQPAEGARSAGTAGRGLDLGGCDIHLWQVQFGYAAGQRVLDGLTLHVPAGRSLAIVGPSGSGKSSIARLLLRLVEHDAGRVLFGHRSIERLDPADIRACIGVVPQDVVLFDDTIAFNVAIGRPNATPVEIEAACRAARIDEHIRSLPAGYDTRVGERGLRLSGGERQRIAIARALIKRPAIFVLDEATSALDARTETAILDDLDQALAGRTTIIITHRLAAARRADRIAVLDGGRIFEQGTHAELLARGGAYARMWQVQASLGDDGRPRACRA